MMKVLLDVVENAVFGSFPLVQSLQLCIFFIRDISSPALLLPVCHQFVVLCFQVREVQIRRVQVGAQLLQLVSLRSEVLGQFGTRCSADSLRTAGAAHLRRNALNRERRPAVESYPFLLASSCHCQFLRFVVQASFRALHVPSRSPVEILEIEASWLGLAAVKRLSRSRIMLVLPDFADSGAFPLLSQKVVASAAAPFGEPFLNRHQSVLFGLQQLDHMGNGSIVLYKPVLEFLVLYDVFGTQVGIFILCQSIEHRLDGGSGWLRHCAVAIAYRQSFKCHSSSPFQTNSVGGIGIFPSDGRHRCRQVSQLFT